MCIYIYTLHVYHIYMHIAFEPLIAGSNTHKSVTQGNQGERGFKDGNLDGVCKCFFFYHLFVEDSHFYYYFFNGMK